MAYVVTKINVCGDTHSFYSRIRKLQHGNFKSRFRLCLNFFKKPPGLTVILTTETREETCHRFLKNKEFWNHRKLEEPETNWSFYLQLSPTVINIRFCLIGTRLLSVDQTGPWRLEVKRCIFTSLQQRLELNKDNTAELLQFLLEHTLDLWSKRILLSVTDKWSVRGTVQAVSASVLWGYADARTEVLQNMTFYDLKIKQ